MSGKQLTGKTTLACFFGMLLIFAGCAVGSEVAAPREDSARSISLNSDTRLLGQAAVYISDAGESLEVVHDVAVGSAIVKLPDGSVVIIPEEIAGIEGRYRNKRMIVWENNGSVLLWIDGSLVFRGKGVN